MSNQAPVAQATTASITLPHLTLVKDNDVLHEITVVPHLNNGLAEEVANAANALRITQEELLDMIALHTYPEAEPLPEGERAFGIQMTPKLAHRVETVAAYFGQTVDEYVQRAIESSLEGDCDEMVFDQETDTALIWSANIPHFYKRPDGSTYAPPQFNL